MKSQWFALVLCVSMCGLFLQLVACSVPASAIKLNVEQNEYCHERAVEKPQEEVWSAVSSTLQDQGFSIAKSDKGQGYILTNSQQGNQLKAWTADLLSGVSDRFTTVEVWLKSESETKTSIKLSIMETSQRPVGFAGGGPNDPTLGMVRENSQDNYLAYDPLFDAIGAKLGIAIPHLFRDKK